MSLLEAISEACSQQAVGLSNAKIKEALLKGAVWVQNKQQKQPVRIRRAKKEITAQDMLFINYDESVLNSSTAVPELLYDFKDYSVWYKPKGMLCQGSKWADHTVINRWIEIHHQRPSWIVHRLDKATDGLILIAHNKSTAAKLAKLFENKQVAKTYRAAVSGKFEPETITLTTPVNEKSAISHITLKTYQKDNNLSILNITIETGRKHQIRAHLASIGFPIVGDRLYNSSDLSTDLQLTAIKLELQGNEPDYQQTFIYKELSTNDKSN